MLVSELLPLALSLQKTERSYRLCHASELCPRESSKFRGTIFTPNGVTMEESIAGDLCLLIRTKLTREKYFTPVGTALAISRLWTTPLIVCDTVISVSILYIRSTYFTERDTYLELFMVGNITDKRRFSKELLLQVFAHCASKLQRN